MDYVIEDLIIEGVKRMPILYQRNDSDYCSDKNDKMACFEAIAAEVCKKKKIKSITCK